MSDTYFTRLREFASEIRPFCIELDAKSAVCIEWYAEFVSRELHVGGSAIRPFAGDDFCEALATLSEASGAFAFLALQQFVANMMTLGKLGKSKSHPAMGVSFGYLRNPDGPAPKRSKGTVTGLIPWFTGSEIFTKTVFGYRDEEMQEILALIPVAYNYSFHPYKEMALIACSGTQTVRVQVRGIKIPESAILSVKPRGSMREGDAASVISQTPLLVGNIRSCIQLISMSDGLSQSAKIAAQSRTDFLLDCVREAFLNGVEPEEGRRIRAEIGDYAVRLARLAMMTEGAASLGVNYIAQLRYKEAIVFNLMAQTDEIVEDAFRSVFF